MKRTLVKILSAGTGLVLAAATGAAAYAAIATEEPSVVRQVTVTGATEAAAADPSTSRPSTSVRATRSWRSPP